ncbi:MAG: tyrosine-type recombinase/integrase, partial [Gemmobacter sp.]
EAEVTFAQAALAYRAAEKSTRFLAKIEDHWKDTPIRQITAGAVRAACMTLYPDAKGATRNRQVIVPTQAIINHAAELGWCAPLKVKRFPVNAKVKAPATAEWVQAFAAEASPHLGALCLFMFATAARISEGVRLAWGDVDLDARTAVLSGNKPKPWTRKVHLPPLVVAALANVPSNRDPAAPVFGYAGAGSVKQPWDSVVQRADIERLTPHCCRHGFATTMLRKGFDVATVAKLGGWKDAATVLRTYAHAIEDRTLSDAVFSTPQAQAAPKKPVTNCKERTKRA